MTDDDLAWLLAVEEGHDPEPGEIEAMKGTFLFAMTRLRLACMEAVEAVRIEIRRMFGG